MYKYKSLKNQLLSYFVIAIILLLICVFVAVDMVHTRNARVMITKALQVSANTLESQLLTRSNHLLEATRLLSGDFAFKQAFFTRDKPTILSAMRNHQNRIGADMMMLAGLEGELIASTLDLQLSDNRFPFELLLDEVEGCDDGTAQGLVLVDGSLYQVVAVPLLAPIPKGWFFVGFRIDQGYVSNLKNLTHSDVSILAKRVAGQAALKDDPNRPSIQVVQSTLSRDQQNQLIQQVVQENSSALSLLPVDDDQLVTQVIGLNRTDHHEVSVFLQRSLNQALLPFQRVRQTFIIIGCFAFGVAVYVVHLLSRTIVKPLNRLALSAKQVQEGQYQSDIEVTQQDEIGRLQQAFGHMLQGLRERDKVRGLLGKVVSEEIAEELLKGAIELGGEEK